MRIYENINSTPPSITFGMDVFLPIPVGDHVYLRGLSKFLWYVRLWSPLNYRNRQLGQEDKMNWMEELRTAFRTTEELEAFLGCKVPKTPYSIFLPRNFAKKIKNMGPNSSLWKQFIPQVEENSPEGLMDPIGDQEFLKAAQLIHRYKNRALFLPTTICPVICRYCFRKNELGAQDLFLPHFKETLDYLINNPQIEELIFSGGDPFVLSDEKISFYLEEFKKISSIKYIRFHTRTPIILPSRITPNLVKTLKEYSSKKITIAIHVNHFEELDHEVAEAILKLKGINLISQTVLLREVNDDPKILKKLIHHLISLDIRPYYLHHPDKVKGGMNYYLDINRGREIYHSLRDEVPGWALFNYVVDLPGGKGKSPAFNPETFAFSGSLLGKDGNLYPY